MYRKWICLFSAVLIFFVAALCALNYAADPFGYWEVQRGEIDRSSTYDKCSLQRHIKCGYIARNPEKYSAVIFGGSNAGALSPELMTELTGNRTYNFWASCGDSTDYFQLTEFCVRTIPNLREIFIQISNEEMHSAEKELTLKLPAFVTGEPILLERLSFLFFNPYETVAPFVRDVLRAAKPERTLAEQFFVPPENARPLNGSGETIDGQYEIYYHALPDEIRMEAVIGSGMNAEPGYLEYHLKELFGKSLRDFKDGALCAENLRKIKSLCDENGIRLTVAIGATFIGKKSRFEGEQYYSWLQQLVSVTPIWDFGGFFDANLNPWNFYETYHYNYETADEMLKIIYGQKQNPEFGVYLTAENVGQYVAARREKFAALRIEYEATGTVRLFGRDDASCLGK